MIIPDSNGLVPAIPITWHGRAPVIGVAGTSPAMTVVEGRRRGSEPFQLSHLDAATMLPMAQVSPSR
jgi:hypothetical protein